MRRPYRPGPTSADDQAAGAGWTSSDAVAPENSGSAGTREAAHADTRVTPDRIARITPGCHHAKSVATPSCRVTIGTKPLIVAATAYANDSAEYRKWSGKRSFMR